MKIGKMATSLVCALALSASLVNFNAEAKSQLSHESPSQTLNGEIVETDWRYDYKDESTANKETIKKSSSFVSWYAEGIDGTFDMDYAGSIRTDRDKIFYRTSVSIPSNTSWTYTWSETVSEKNYSEHNFDASISGSGQFWVFAEVEAEVGYAYRDGVEKTIQRNTKEEIKIDSAGTYELTWYFISDRYDMTADWYYYTIDDPSTRKRQYDRVIGEVIVPTKYLHLDVDKL
ncbi:hypothetical protein [Chengkuizengella marina]|uniref:Uncharacterized protein n=1 Tax=Chengkuizengella marina TaxID=2507566 RepID=A0A6N9PZD6_9BACL|nr:hypothetical protein [Chengkuizengella marina]NBI28172.1 hypothetical protein [Chengkuizengella marina]